MEPGTREKVINAMGDAGREDIAAGREVMLDEFRNACERTPGINMLLLSTADGRAVADWSMQGTDPRRLAAMTNSFLTLGETVARELGMSSADYATICTKQGNMVLIRLDLGRPMTLAAVGTPETNLAVLLYGARECATRIRARLT
ncbi:hypothetical protein SAMN05428989_0883 [Pseudoxanthomonas sp. GM95]|uniref:roadblock/LC7 domain-containing protein n=1 Tax=Pseudoxanthomonas sp. GM95 TaxID=1881043 RepID=UPI0008BB629F|nr:roadblock/LC7 domain-containing protein [Pseudoxanthomonas sp. GM95]SEK82803.1 hypothetical protein SAMN05428989_0883 [Pseudoxanthomonas sp. GM95]